MIYREVLHKSNTSVIFTSHSTFIASVTPLNSIVHIRRIDKASKIFSTANLAIDEGEKEDIERYIDAKRGELYFGKGIILVEGITEEYFIPASANLIGSPLDDYGIIVCNINSTNFKPYVQLLNLLNIPWDGDYYEEITIAATATSKAKTTKEYHVMDTAGTADHFKGHEIVAKLLTDLSLVDKATVDVIPSLQHTVFREQGIFVGYYTLEVDIMDQADSTGLNTIKNVYKELSGGGSTMQKNFEDALDAKEYWSALQKIEENTSKGRFAQRLSGKLTVTLIPAYIKDGIEKIITLVNQVYE